MKNSTENWQNGESANAQLDNNQKYSTKVIIYSIV